MSRRIYKFPIPIEDDFLLSFPVGTEVLTVQAQRNQPVLWCLLDIDIKESETRVFHLAGTGHPFPDSGNWQYINTFQLDGGALVFHLFVMKQ